jgi:membrane-associated PAP2 superfamily phosphatase
MQTHSLAAPASSAVGALHPSRHSSLPLSLAWLALLAFTLVWDFTGLDMVIMQAIGTPEGFPLKDQWLLSTVLHDQLRVLAQGLFLVMVGWAVWPARNSGLPRRERLLLVGLVLLSLLAVNIIKINSRTSCPWDLQVFGGSARYVSHWLLGVGDGGGGRCFPGGHASSAMAFFALCLPWLHAPAGTERDERTGWRWLALILIVGLIAGGAQTLRGAHHPSHTLWTLLICSGISIAGWRLSQPWLQRGAAKGQTLAAGKP